ncbi:MAG: hypothetical protein QM755_16910 [Luteolibacter sp.]
MPEQKVSWIVVILGLARAILHDRPMRRRFLLQLLMMALGMMAIGLWVIEGWLAKHILWFTIWWGCCALLTGSVMIFALYDALAVIREEREKIDRE